MKLSYPGPSYLKKLLALYALVFIVLILGYRSYANKSSKVEIFDDLNNHIGGLRVQIAKLEYTLDMFVVARRFEGTTVNLIKGDVAKLDEGMSAVIGNARYRRLMEKNKPLSEVMESISSDWQTIKDEVRKLNAAMSREEIMLLHNDVDMNTVLITEKADRLLGMISESRNRIVREMRTLALEGVVGFVLLAAFSGIALHKKILSPVRKASSTARSVAENPSSGARFEAERWSATRTLARELNAMLSSIGAAAEAERKRAALLLSEIVNRDAQIDSLHAVSSVAGRSLSQNDVFNAAVKEAIVSAGAKAAAVYMMEEGSFKLRAHRGLTERAVREGMSLPADAVDCINGGGDRAVPSGVGGIRSSALSGILMRDGMESLIAAPIVYNNETVGVLFAFYASLTEGQKSAASFLRATASCIAISSGFINMLHREMNSKRFLDRIIQQMPYGVAVFDREGRCVTANVALKRLLCAEHRLTFASDYSLSGDGNLGSPGIIGSIRRSYDGYSSEFVISYNPALSMAFNPGGAVKKVRIKSHPLYDSGGEITSIMLIFEEFSEFAEAPARSGGMAS